MTTLRFRRRIAVTLLVVGGWVVPAVCESPKEGLADADFMREWNQAISPGSHHEPMRRYVGQWAATVRVWSHPGAEPVISAGRSEYRLLLGDRYLMQSLDCQLLGQPFHGIGISGYDNGRRKHTVIWIDNMGTAMMHSEGDCNGDHTLESHEAVVRDPLGGPDRTIRMIRRVIDERSHAQVFFVTGPDGREFRSMEVTYNRL